VGCYYDAGGRPSPSATTADPYHGAPEMAGRRAIRFARRRATVLLSCLDLPLASHAQLLEDEITSLFIAAV